MKKLLLLLAFLPGVVAAQERPSDYRYSAPVRVDAVGSHYRLTLPAAVYRDTERHDLGDVRIFNAGGEPVPYAFANRAATAVSPKQHGVNLFPLHGDRAKGLDATSVRVERTSHGTVVNVSVSDAPPAARRVLLGYLVDATEFKAPKDALLLTWQAREGFSGQARVEGSDDLKNWNTLAAAAPVLFLEHDGARLERRRIELGGARAPYLRLSFSGVPREFALTDVKVELRPEKPEPAREWLSVAAIEGKTRAELLFDTAGHFPVDRLRFGLPQPNTVAQVQLLTRERAADKWRVLVSATAYRLAREGGDDIVSPDIVVPVTRERYWMAQVEQKGGGFGAGEVQIELGWVPHEIVFVARGAAPFSLAYANRKAKPGALPVASVLLQQGEHQIMEVKRASVGDISGSAQPAPSLFGEPGRFLSHLSENRDLKKWTLWAALLAGVLLLAGMAFRLLRNLGDG
jgi:hypothetical protein